MTIKTVSADSLKTIMFGMVLCEGNNAYDALVTEEDTPRYFEKHPWMLSKTAAVWMQSPQPIGVTAVEQTLFFERVRCYREIRPPKDERVKDGLCRYIKRMYLSEQWETAAMMLIDGNCRRTVANACGLTLDDTVTVLKMMREQLPCCDESDEDMRGLKEAVEWMLDGKRQLVDTTASYAQKKGLPISLVRCTEQNILRAQKSLDVPTHLMVKDVLASEDPTRLSEETMTAFCAATEAIRNDLAINERAAYRLLAAELSRKKGLTEDAVRTFCLEHRLSFDRLRGVIYDESRRRRKKLIEFLD